MKYEVVTIRAKLGEDGKFTADIPDNAVGITVNPKVEYLSALSDMPRQDIYYCDISYLVPVEEVAAPVDRCTYDEGADIIDEVVMHNATVHLEALSDTTYMLIVDNGIHHWHLKIFAKNKRSHVIAWMYEDNSVKEEN